MDLVMSEAASRAILQAAINEGRAAELLEALFDGGSATVDASTGKLVIVDAAMIAGLVDPSTGGLTIQSGFSVPLSPNLLADVHDGAAERERMDRRQRDR